ncbi:MAG: YdcF family protein [Actinobacteria bacterium]|nr:YdcF family protein [Actinomycetota bacterium]
MFLFKLFRRVIAFLLLLVIVVPVFALGKTWYAANNPTIRNADVIVVLGAAQLDGRPGLVLEARLTEAKRIYDLGLAKKIITVGGGAPGDRTTEAATGRIWLMQNGVKYANLKAIEVGRDTLSSTKAYAAELRARKIKNVIIVTDPLHCLRSMTMANDLGLIATCSPVQGGPNALEKSGFKYLIREAGAYLAYITLGRHGVRISDRLPSDNILNKVTP